MSRIHDALRIAEKTGVQNIPEIPTPESASPEVSVPATSIADPHDLISAAVAAANREPNKQSVALTRREKWHPDPRVVLNFTRDDVSGTEPFRTLRARLHQIKAHRPLRSILISSAMQAEGKSFVATNLAHAMANEPGSRVLLIDGDLRRRRLHQFLGSPSEPGLGDYLRNNASESDIIQRGQIDNLFFIAAGSARLNAAELLTGARIEMLMKRLAATFDWIIVDSPPALPVSDSSLLASLCDGVLLVVNCGETPIDAAAKTVQEFDRDSILGVVLNRTKVDARYAAYYGSYGIENDPRAKR